MEVSRETPDVTTKPKCFDLPNILGICLYIYIYIYIYSKTTKQTTNTKLIMLRLSQHTCTAVLAAASAAAATNLSLSIYIYMYMYMYIYIYIYTSIPIYLSIYLSIYLYIYISIHLSLSIYIYIYDIIKCPGWRNDSPRLRREKQLALKLPTALFESRGISSFRRMAFFAALFIVACCKRLPDLNKRDTSEAPIGIHGAKTQQRKKTHNEQLSN